MNTNNRLQFRYHDQVFDTREAAIEYIQSQIRFTEQGLAAEDPRYGYSLLAEPTVLLYKNITEDDPEGEDNPHLIIALGSVTNEGTQYSDNRFCIIDIDKTEQEIADLREELEKAIKSLTLVALSSDTLNFYAEKTDDGTFVSGDVKVAESHIFDNIRKDNNLMVTPEGIFIYVNLVYDEEEETFTFTVSKADGTLEVTSVKLPNNYVVRGYYDKRDESIHLILRDGSEVLIDCEKLIAEWGVEGEASKTPVVLTREEVDYDHTDEHHHVEPWQDVLKADVRIKDEHKVLQPDGNYKYVKDENSTNILSRTSDARYLYVDGKASNIIYYMNGERSNVKEALDALSKIKLSSDNDNILIEKTDGFFASTKLSYVSKENKLIFKVSGQEDTIINLNGFKLFENIYYDPTNESLVITYIDGNDKVQIVTIPIGDMIRDWEWEPQNEGHNVTITKKRNVTGNDKVSADVKISSSRNNILEDDDHKLYVRGEADNIKFEPTGDTTVKDVLVDLKEADEVLNEKIDNEIERATTAEEALDAKIDQEIADRTTDVERIDTTIGTGFTTDTHETVTYKFEQLQNQVNEEAEKLQNEIDRSKAKDDEHDGKIQAIEDEIGDGFGPRNTIRDEIDNLQDEIDAVSADSSSRLSDVINEDKSIDVETRNDDNNKPTIKVLKVNLSEEIEHNKPNIIKLNADGLYAGVDLSYEETANKLIFSTTNGSKEIQLESMSSIISIEYNPTKEAIVITYMTNGHEIKTVEIPVGDLINEWRVEDGHPHAVQLEKVRVASGTSEQDILKASVIINDAHNDNILVMDDGALYVSGEPISAATAAIDALEDRMDAAEADIDTLESGLAAEIARATSEEQRIESKLDSEIERSTGKDDEHDTKIQQLRVDLEEEIDRASQAEDVLHNEVVSETNRATLAETALSGAVTSESQRAQNAEASLQSAIDTEIANREHIDDDLLERINNEITRSTNKDNELTTALNNEANERRTADTNLQNAITAEQLARTEKDAELQSAISTESARSISEETRIETKLDNEITRSTTEDDRLNNMITGETANRIAADEALDAKIDSVTLTFEDTPSIDFNNPYNENNIVKANVKLQEGENIIKLGEGLYASVNLSYDPARNTIKLVTSNGEQEAIQLNTVGSLIDGMEYDPVNRALVITYHDAAGNPLHTSFPVNELFNDWIIQNPSEKSALELTKVINSGDTADVLSGRVLITDDHNGDGKPDQGSDNIIEIRNNGLYVDGTPISAAVETAECAKEELKAVEKAVFGHIAGDCGEGFVYEPMPGTTYINSATTVNNATFLLDLAINKLSSYTENVEEEVFVVSGDTQCLKKELKTVENNILGMPLMNECGEGDNYRPNDGTNYIFSGTSFNNVDIILDREIKEANIKIENLSEEIDAVSAETECIDSKTEALYKLMYGSASTMTQCGSGNTYQPYTLGCVINSATSFSEADVMLDQQICEILTMWVSGETCTTISDWIEDGSNRKMQVDVKLSHGNTAEMTDEDLTTIDLTGDYIDPTRTEFTDTNALRIICLQSGPSGVTPSVETKQNGIYLSNVWDCGMYYGPGDTVAKAAAEAAGYKTNYSTDEREGRSGYNYMNNVRQSDIPHN